MAVVLSVGCLARAGVAPTRSAGDLNTPSISIPYDGGKPDPVVEKMQRVLASHTKEFTGGHYLNAHSVLHFGGGTKTINALLQELSKVDGVTLHVRLAKGPGVTRLLVGEKGPCVCSVEHNGWGNAQQISVTVYLGSEGVNADDLDLPAIQGH
jgi:hypothetical protein